jgi:hypothetical protein
LNIGFVIAVVILLFSAVYHHKRKQQKTNESPSLASRRRALNPETQFRCVEIRTSSTACLAARNYKGQKFLMEQAPVLPLNACTNHRCDCRFVRYSDRRANDRRATLAIANQIIGNGQLNAEKNDRRKYTDRRKASPAMA